VIAGTTVSLILYAGMVVARNATWRRASPFWIIIVIEAVVRVTTPGFNPGWDAVTHREGLKKRPPAGLRRGRTKVRY